MNRNLALGFAACAALSATAEAATFAHAPIAADRGVDGLTRAVAREFTGRAVFAQPWATVTLSHVDVYDRFPYVESRQFQIVSDPAWNRLVAGELDHGLVAFDGKGTSAGALAAPHGLAVDERDRVYVADTGHDRIVVLQARTEFDQVSFAPLYTIDGLHEPWDLAYSDGGTPFVDGDDALVVANTGRNEIVAYALGAAGARLTARMGTLGSGEREFAGPSAVAFGRHDGANTTDVYVADAHNRRIVTLELRGGALRWSGAADAGATILTSLDTDHFGSVYAAAPREGLVRKFSRTLEPVADLRGAVARPRSFRIPFATVRDHRDGSATRRGHAAALSVDDWSDASGLGLWNLGVSVEQLNATGDAARFVLTDPADVAVELSSGETGAVLARRTLGTLDAGAHEVPLAELREAAGGADRVRVAATSRYAQGATVTASVALGTGDAVAPARAALLGHWPNPVRESARISFAVPAGTSGATLEVFDAAGRRVRTLGADWAAGTHVAEWDGRDASGARVQAGCYWYRLRAGGVKLSRRLVVVR
ncbi:MAG: FlgD immunoglobulin-like domain containing protein [Candidatus Eisenbacteria bacterium]